MKEILAKETLERKYGRPINLQLFAEGGEGDEGSKEGEDNAGEEKNPPAGKTFTQEEVNAMMAKEKNQGKLSVLKELGVEDSKSAKEALAKYKEYLDSQKTEAEKLAEALKAEQATKTQAEQKAAALEKKFEAIVAGVPATKADDVVLLASAKVTDTKDFKAVLEEMKTTYPEFFEDSNSGGTGSNTGSKKLPGKGAGSLGKRIAEASAKNQVKTTNYFTN